MIPTYNCAGFLRETLASVLAQDPGSDAMQIEVVDDASTRDDPEAVVQELGDGRVAFFRQPRNTGHVANFNTCIHRSRGRLVHILHGDDLVRPGFYDAMATPFELHAEVGAAFCRDERIDENGELVSVSAALRTASGVLEGWLETIAVGQRLQAPAIVVRRAVYEHLGGFDRRISCYGEDWEMWVRIAAHYAVWYQAEPLAAYRIHTRSLTARGVQTGAHADDYRRVIEINRAHLPDDHAEDWSRAASINFARACMRRGWRALGSRDRRSAAAHFREGFRTSRSWRVLVEFGRHGADLALKRGGRVLGAIGARRGSRPEAQR